MPKKFYSHRKYQIAMLIGVGVVALAATAVLTGQCKLLKLCQPLISKEKQTVTYALPQPRTYEQPIALPKPKLASALSVEAAMQQRRSRREFSPEPVKLAELSQMLWAAQGITDPETGHRSAPSARGVYPFTVFVVVRNVSGLNPGLYEYLPKTHALGDLKLVNAGDLLNTSGVQPGAQQAPVVFLLSAAYGPAQKTLGESVVSSSLLEAGHIGQNMYLQTESLKMSMVVMAGFDAKKVGSAISLDPAETVVYVVPFGHTAPPSATKEVLGTTTSETKLFTAEELAKYNGKNGQQIYFAYEGKVYDVTGSDKWIDGEHYGLQAGTDLTGKLGEAPHGGEVVEGFQVVGTFNSPAAAGSAAAAEEVSAPDYTMYYLLGGVGAVALVGAGILMMQGKGKKRK